MTIPTLSGPALSGSTIIFDLGRQPAAPLGLPASLRPIRRQIERLTCGRLSLFLPDGRQIEIRGNAPGPGASLILRNRRVLRSYMLAGANGFAQSYLDGDWDTPDLPALLRYFLANNLPSSSRGSVLHRIFARLRHYINRNSRAGSRRNIAAHYDLGNAFYRLWLDPGMTYSSGLYAPGDDLAAAQARKYRHISDLATLAPGQRVLEIGCGWGGFAEQAARIYGAQVTGITLSQAQLDHARARITAAGLEGQVELRLQDYRDLSGQFDRIISIEMIEAVGRAYWPDYFRCLRQRLAPGGQIALQAILIDDARFAAYCDTPDFIQRAVFPGGMLPCAAVIREQAAAVGLRITAEHRFGTDYARTLASWRTRFTDAWPQIEALGFDARFRRLWTYYLAYCEAGFAEGRIDVRQILLTAL